MEHLIAQFKGNLITVQLIAHDITDSYDDLIGDFDESFKKELIQDLEYGRQIAFDLECSVTLNATNQKIGLDWIGHNIYPSYEDAFLDVLNDYDVIQNAVADALTHDFRIFDSTFVMVTKTELEHFRPELLEVVK